VKHRERIQDLLPQRDSKSWKYYKQIGGRKL